MNTDKPLSQIESRLVADWLRSDHKVPVANGLVFWRKRPATVAEWIRAEHKIKVTAVDVLEAAGREE